MTLVFGARDAGHNNAVALKEYPERHGGIGDEKLG
jgi:hypothetical protein